MKLKLPRSYKFLPLYIYIYEFCCCLLHPVTSFSSSTPVYSSDPFMTAIKPFYCALHDHHNREQHFNDYNARSIVWSRCYRETLLGTDFNKILRITSPGNICSIERDRYENDSFILFMREIKDTKKRIFNSVRDTKIKKLA